LPALVGWCGLRFRDSTMFQLTVTTGFSGAHYLKGYDGPCARLHGHNFRVDARVSGCDLDSVGMVVDFKVIKKLLKAAISRFDHQVSNEIPPFDEINPTAENLARYLYDQLQPAIEEFGARLDSIGIWETDSYGVVYTPGG